VHSPFHNTYHLEEAHLTQLCHQGDVCSKGQYQMYHVLHQHLHCSCEIKINGKTNDKIPRASILLIKYRTRCFIIIIIITSLSNYGCF
jgi:hypothetical protein